jgi:hypothetical protein
MTWSSIIQCSIVTEVVLVQLEKVKDRNVHMYVTDAPPALEVSPAAVDPLHVSSIEPDVFSNVVVVPESRLALTDPE